MSYLRHWQLETSPYRPQAGSYPAPAQQEAMARIDYLVGEKRNLGALVAPRGLGKTVVLEEAGRHHLRDGKYVASIDAFGLTPREFLWQVACAFETQPALGDSVSRLWQKLADSATEHAWRGEQGLVLIDDAGQAGPDLCQQMVRLVRLASNLGAAWNLVLAATPSEASRWPDTLLELMDLRIELYAWDEETTFDYLQHALMSAGRLEPVFTEDALYRIHVLAQGIPRHVARLADFSLVVGAAAEVSIIDTSVVESAQEQVSWPTAVAS
ncbi:AAA family ATPase [Aeoliella mucimassa]|uniref:ORC1/DEAH AAA+ ATPase domain-containing protein n=1 Tax=Aeoliella mucimassa TaxID=2527972 RepID=A0A518AHI0_9BACT|nr:AAA family ATPase [Aeoliella mucimassa]QDU54172.1 hypothetical protein Pan181_03520 [Aeoliella mucimassa]